MPTAAVTMRQPVIIKLEDTTGVEGVEVSVELAIGGSDVEGPRVAITNDTLGDELVTGRGKTEVGGAEEMVGSSEEVRGGGADRGDVSGGAEVGADSVGDDGSDEVPAGS